MKVLGEAGQDREMWGIVPADDGSVRKELVRIEEILCRLDKPDLQVIRRSEELTADPLHGAIHRLVCKQDMPGCDKIRDGQDGFHLLNVQLRRHF